MRVVDRCQLQIEKTSKSFFYRRIKIPGSFFETKRMAKIVKINVCRPCLLTFDPGISFLRYTVQEDNVSSNKL